jgi:hypothetical protein
MSDAFFLVLGLGAIGVAAPHSRGFREIASCDPRKHAPIRA